MTDGGAPAQPAPAVIALVGGLVFASPAATPLDDTTVLIEGGRIVTVRSRAQVQVPRGARIIDCRNKLIAAGFQNSHVHFTEPHWAGAATQPAGALTALLERMPATRSSSSPPAPDAAVADGSRADADAVCGDRECPRDFPQVADYAAMGGDILFGTDAGYHQTYDTRLEYRSLGEAGLDWRQILAALTTAPARRFGEGGQRGEIAEGMAGDVVVLGADPRDDLQAFADVHVVIRAGRIIFEEPVDR